MIHRNSDERLALVSIAALVQSAAQTIASNKRVLVDPNEAFNRGFTEGLNFDRCINLSDSKNYSTKILVHQLKSLRQDPSYNKGVIESSKSLASAYIYASTKIPSIKSFDGQEVYNNYYYPLSEYNKLLANPLQEGLIAIMAKDFAINALKITLQPAIKKNFSVVISGIPFANLNPTIQYVLNANINAVSESAAKVLANLNYRPDQINRCNTPRLRH
jgi:hypothetical protein